MGFTVRHDDYDNRVTASFESTVVDLPSGEVRHIDQQTNFLQADDDEKQYLIDRMEKVIALLKPAKKASGVKTPKK